VAAGQAFRNLDFESSILESPDIVRAIGWNFSGEEGIFPQGDAIYTGLHIGLVPYQRMLTDLVMVPGSPPLPIQGHFSVLMGGPPFGPSGDGGPWMEQTGRIPTLSRFIRLLGDQDPWGHRGSDPTATAWRLTIDGTEIPLTELDGSPTTLSGDISAFAGSVRTLRIAINGNYALYVNGNAVSRPHSIFDRIQFFPVPEFNSAILLTVAGFALPMLRRKESRRPGR
jgi:hypothetical protein